MAGHKVGEIYGEIKIKNQQFNAGLAQTQSKLKGFKISSVAIFAAIAAGSYVMIKGLKDAVTAASNLEEQTAKFGTVFTGVMDKANEAIKTLTELYGMSTREARQHMAAVQDLLVPMGMMRDKAANLSFEIVKLATDLGSFNNLPTEQVMNDIESALTGQYRTMRKYGVVLFDTDVRQRALNMGLAETNDKLTAGDRALAAYTMMMEGSKDATGDFIRTSDSFANSMKILRGRVEDLQASIGEKFLPLLSRWVGSLAEVTKEITKLSDALEVNILKAERAKSAIGDFVKGIALGFAVIGEVVNDIRTFLSLAFSTIARSIAVFLELMAKIPGVSESVDELAQSFRALEAGAMAQAVALELQKGWVERIVDSYKDATKEAKKFGKETKKAIQGNINRMGEFHNIGRQTFTDLSVFAGMGRTSIEGVDESIFNAKETAMTLGDQFLETMLMGEQSFASIADSIGGVIRQLIVAIAKALILKFIMSAIGLAGGGYVPPGAGAVPTAGAQKGAYIPAAMTGGKAYPTISSGWVTQPHVLVGEGRGGELVIPEDKMKDMVHVDFHNASPHSWAEVIINLPQGERQRIYRRAIKPAADVEGKR